MIQWALAHQVDDATRIARAAKQAGRAAQHFDVVELGQVVDLVAIEGADTGTDVHGRGAIDLDVVDAEPARGELGQAEVTVFYGDAGGALHGVGQVGHAQVFDSLLADHRHRLRSVFDTGRGLGADTGQAGGVRPGVFGGFTHALALDGGRTQFHYRASTGAGVWYQQVAAVSLLFGAVAAVGEDVCEASGHLVLAIESGTGFTGSQPGVGGQGDAGLATELAKHLVKGARGNVEVHCGALLHLAGLGAGNDQMTQAEPTDQGQTKPGGTGGGDGTSQRVGTQKHDGYP
ncbi:hypothetical protein D3C84_616690 [compost metagenome]